MSEKTYAAILALLFFIVPTAGFADTCNYVSKTISVNVPYHLWLTDDDSMTITLYINSQAVGSLQKPERRTLNIPGSITYNGNVYTVGGFQKSYCSGGQACARLLQEFSYCYAPDAPAPAPAPAPQPEPAPTNPEGGYTPPVTTPPVDVPTPTVIPPNVPQVSQPADYDVLCNEGYTGKIHHSFSIYYTTDTYSTVMSDGTPTTAQASTPHVSETINDSCTIIPTQNTDTVQKVQEQTCDSYYGSATGTYYGTVYKYATYTSTYDQNTKSTSTSFIINNNDISSCVPQFTDTSMDRRTRPCPAGQVGEIQEYIYKAINTRGEAVYPYGTNWQQTINSCADTQVDNSLANEAAATPSGLLGNISVTSSDLRLNDRFTKYLDSLTDNGWKSNEKHKLLIEVDDINTGAFNAQSLGMSISKFQKIVGVSNSEIEIKLPHSIDKYIGISGITEQAVQNKSISMKGVSFDGHDAKIMYLEIGNSSLSKPKENTATINIIPQNIKINNIGGE